MKTPLPKLRIFLLPLLLLSLTAGSQSLAKHGLVYKNTAYEVFIIRVDSSVGRGFSIVENDSHLPEAVYFNQPADRSSFFAITASIVDSSCAPLGLYLSEGKLNHDINRQDGNGNFYLKPNGWIGADTSGRICVRTTDRYHEKEIRTAIQSGPMLIIDGQINPAFDNKSRNRNTRCGVGEFKDHGHASLVFARSDNPVTFFEMAGLFKEKYRCDNALNLESGDFCSIHLPNLSGDYSAKQVICRYLLIHL